MDNCEIIKPEPECDYYQLAYESISAPPEKSIIFFDIDGTSVITKDNKPSIREDFINLYNTVRNESPNIQICAITYRTRDTGIHELSKYPFDQYIYNEDIHSMLKKYSQNELLIPIIDAVQISPTGKGNRRFLFELMQYPVYKLRLILSMFGEYSHEIFLLDDGIDGEYAEKLGYGMKVRL